MSFRADDPPTAGAEPAADEGVFDQGARGAAEPGAPVEEPSATVDEPSAPVDEPSAAVDEPSAAVDEPSAAVDQPRTDRQPARNMLPGRHRRRFGLERVLMRVIATGGIVGIGVAIAAILAASKVQGWIIGLAVAVLSVILSGLLWSSREL